MDWTKRIWTKIRSTVCAYPNFYASYTLIVYLEWCLQYAYLKQTLCKLNILYAGANRGDY